jgi:succinyl-CoA synthetase beta subunit
MHLHEYQAKKILAEYGLPVPKGVMVNSVDQALLALNFLNTEHWVVKAQIYAGGRGKAGGVKLVGSKEQLAEVARQLLHTRLLTHQTDAKGQLVNELLVEETCDIQQEFYLGMLVDRSTKQVLFVASASGGVDIEAVARDQPEAILKVGVDPLLGVIPYKCRDLAIKLKLNSLQSRQLTRIMTDLYKVFIENDLNLLEINPLVVTKRGDMMCLDAKMNVDDNALYRQPTLRAMLDTSQEDAEALLAREWELNYVALDGTIGCMVNGAGLAMATMDLIQLKGGSPANFLDVGGSATEERVREAFKIILLNKQVKAVLVNIFGGIVRCDLIAAGIIKAVSEVGVTVPVVVRLEGNHAIDANHLLAQSGLNIIVAKTFEEAANRAIEAARR